ncbi:uncharacterized protein LOC114337857 [Diabrotica virgifera virgifera]|uniref:Uncharacterized protein n=1 Tax=Diabrotica virgifera virgifera TaxID=50390 RepID=A0ABM5IVS9_DIAVI|nr:uncharacterized protein LOC114337857 [Diabrotica virgifera virgifera]
MKKSGAGAQFHSKWLAYDALVFLRDKNKVRPCKESEAENVDDLNDSSSETDLDDSQVTDCDEGGNETQEFQDAENGNEGMKDLYDDGSQNPSTSNAACEKPSASNKSSQEPRKKTVENPNSTNLDEFKHPNKTRRVTQTLTRKIDDNARKEEAYKIIQDIQNKRQRDKFDVFGEHMACKIRDLNTTCAQNIVEHLIGNILFDASMGKYDYGMPQSTNTYEPILSMQPSTRPQSHSSYCSTPAISPAETYIQNSSDSSTAFGSSNILAEAFQLSNM